MRIFLALVVLLFSFTAAAQNCLDENKVKTITSSFKIVRWNGKSAKQAGSIPLCDSKDILNQIANSLLLIEELQALKPKTDKGIGNDALVLREGPLNYFKNRVKVIVIEDTPRNEACESAGVVAYIEDSEPVMYVCPQEFSSQSELEISTTMIHEARHVDGYDHANCSHGVYYSKDLDISGACDESYELQGSYGVEAGFYLFVAKNSPYEAMAQEGRASFIIAMTSRFNEMPWDLQPGVLAQDKVSGILTFFGDNVSPFKFNVAEGSVLTSRWDMPVFFNLDGTVQHYFYAPALENSEGAVARDFIKNTTPAQRNELIDAGYSFDYGCVLFTRELRCGYDQDFVTIPLQVINPQALLWTPRYGFEIVATNGKTYSLPETILDLMDTTEKNLLKSSRETNLVSYASADNNTFYGTDAQDHLLVRRKNGNWQEHPTAKNKTFKKVIPFFWSPRLEAL